LELWLAYAVVGYGPLRFSEEVDGCSTLDEPDLARACPDGDGVVALFEIEAP